MPLAWSIKDRWFNEIYTIISRWRKSIRETLKIVLENAGYIVITAGDGFEAIEHLNYNMVDILITDLRMPGMNGIQLMEKL